VVELEAQLEEENHSLRLHQQNNAVGFMEQYEKRAEEIKTIEQRMTDRQGETDTIAAEITQRRQIWEPRLDSLVRRVSVAFGIAFDSIGCAGEVLLNKTGGSDIPTDDFGLWAIDIKVKFRDTEDLQSLNAQRQSGGERSVSTIFYLMALQDLATAPFRVVDEINQGMDPRNERLVHKRMVAAACRENTSQYPSYNLVNVDTF
jgi:structural maintenance of chromosomes protein 5